MKKMDAMTWLLIIFTILSIAIIANCEVLISMYQAPSDKNKTVVECAFENGRSDERLVVRNSELDTDKVESWVFNVCIGRDK